MQGQLTLLPLIRTQCSINNQYQCNYYCTAQSKYLCGDGECEATCCYGCKEKRLCGWRCNSCNFDSKRKVEFQ